MAKKILDTVIFLANHLTWLTARGRGDILKVFNMKIMKTRSDCRDKVFCFIVFFIVDFSFYTELLWNCQEDFQKRRSWMLVKPSPQCTQPNMILSGACKCWKKPNKKSFKDYFVHACTVSACILACLCITATFCMWVPVTSKLGIIQSTKTLRQSLFQWTKGKQGKGNAEGFQLEAVWDVKSTFPLAASLSTTQIVSLMITKMPAHFLSYQLYLQSCI